MDKNPMIYYARRINSRYIDRSLETRDSQDCLRKSVQYQVMTDEEYLEAGKVIKAKLKVSTLGEVIRYYLKEGTNENSPSTIRSKEQIFAEIIKGFGSNTPLNMISTERIDTGLKSIQILIPSWICNSIA